MPDGGLDGAAAAQGAFQGPGHAAALAGDVDGGAAVAVDVVAPVSAVNEDASGAGVGEDLDLFDRFVQRVTVIRVPGHRSDADDEAFAVGGGD